MSTEGFDKFYDHKKIWNLFHLKKKSNFCFVWQTIIYILWEIIVKSNKRLIHTLTAELQIFHHKSQRPKSCNLFAITILSNYVHEEVDTRITKNTTELSSFCWILVSHNHAASTSPSSVQTIHLDLTKYDLRWIPLEASENSFQVWVVQVEKEIKSFTLWVVCFIHGAIVRIECQKLHSDA